MPKVLSVIKGAGITEKAKITEDKRIMTNQNIPKRNKNQRSQDQRERTGLKPCLGRVVLLAVARVFHWGEIVWRRGRKARLYPMGQARKDAFLTDETPKAARKSGPHFSVLTRGSLPASGL